jgi:beta-lactamase superfamily II metal-dependent hydrolase
MKKQSIHLVVAFLFSHWFVFAADDSCFKNSDADTGFKVSVLNVGQGNCTQIFDHTKGTMMIVDAGSSKSPENGKKDDIISTNFSAKSGLLALTCIVSHPDKDHLNWFVNLLEGSFKQNPLTIYLGGNIEKYLTSDDGCKLLKSLLSRDHLTVFSLSHNLTKEAIQSLLTEKETYENNEDSKKHLGYEDHQFFIAAQLRKTLVPKIRPFLLNVSVPMHGDCARVKATILGANAGHCPKLKPNQDWNTAEEGEIVNPDENMNSIVLRVSFYDNFFSIIMTGDATGVTTDRLIKHSTPETLFCDAMIACHHGAITHESNNAPWVAATQPKYVIFSAGGHAGYHHPQLDALWNYAKSTRIATDHPQHHIQSAKRLEDKKLGDDYLIIGTLLDSSPTSVPNKQSWIEFQTTKGLFSTHSSGMITFNITDTTTELDTQNPHQKITVSKKQPITTY